VAAQQEAVRREAVQQAQSAMVVVDRLEKIAPAVVRSGRGPHRTTP